jgi:hypothetical protein
MGHLKAVVTKMKPVAINELQHVAKAVTKGIETVSDSVVSQVRTIYGSVHFIFAHGLFYGHIKYCSVIKTFL